MNCEQVQDQLSEYLDRLIDPENLKGVESHLTECPVCRLETYQLSESIRHVASLPVMDPPLGFTQRVMTHVYEIEQTPSLWQQLFFPWRTKLALHATAAVLIAVFSVYLLQKQEAPTPGEQIARSQIADQVNNLPHQVTPLPPSTAEPKKIPTNLALNFATQPTGSPAKESLAKKETNGSAVARSSKLRAISEQSEQGQPPGAPPMEGRRPQNLSIPTISVAGPSANPSELERFSRPLRGPIEPFANYELIFRRRGQTRDQARRDNLSGSMNEETDSANSKSSTPTPAERLLNSVSNDAGTQTIWFSVPKKEYEQFKRELRAIGAIESELPVQLLRTDSAIETEDPLQIKMTVIPGTETNRPPQATPTER
jgi:hypothetical protein